MLRRWALLCQRSNPPRQFLLLPLATPVPPRYSLTLPLRLRLLLAPLVLRFMHDAPPFPPMERGRQHLLPQSFPARQRLQLGAPLPQRLPRQPGRLASTLTMTRLLQLELLSFQALDLARLPLRNGSRLPLQKERGTTTV